MADKRKWVYTLQDIADASRRSIHSVRDDRAASVFDPNDLESVAEYVQGYRTIAKIRDDEAAWGGPGGKGARHD